MAIEVVSLTCIRCPVGCALTATVEGDVVTGVAGNTCPRGKAYAEAEVTNPVRTVTGTVRVRGGSAPVTSVKTVPEVPKAQVLAVAAALADVVAEAPLAIGDVVLADVCGTGSDVVVTKAV